MAKPSVPVRNLKPVQKVPGIQAKTALMDATHPPVLAIQTALRGRSNAAAVSRRHAAAREAGRMARHVLMDATHPPEHAIQTVLRGRNNVTGEHRKPAIAQGIGLTVQPAHPVRFAVRAIVPVVIQTSTFTRIHAKTTAIPTADPITNHVRQTWFPTVPQSIVQQAFVPLHHVKPFTSQTAESAAINSCSTEQFSSIVRRNAISIVWMDTRTAQLHALI